MKENGFAYICGLPWNGVFWVQEGLCAWSQIKLRGFYNVSYYDKYGKKVWEIFGLLPRDIDTLVENYNLIPAQKVTTEEVHNLVNQ